MLLAIEVDELLKDRHEYLACHKVLLLRVLDKVLTLNDCHIATKIDY